jgi:hypothetical protein
VILGFDYASVDGLRPDFAAARAGVGARFVIIRAGWGTWSDPCWQRDRVAAHDAGLVLGSYLTLRWDQDPAEQAKALCATLGTPAATDLPPAVDVEFPAGRVATGLTAAAALDHVLVAVATIGKLHGTCMIYTSARVWHEDMDNIAAPGLAMSCPLWVKTPYPYRAREPLHLVTGRWEVPAPWCATAAAPTVIEQFQGDAIGVPGFPGTVDVSRFVVPGASNPWIAARLAGLSTSEFQTKHGLASDGVIGPRTFAELARVSA